MHIPSGWFIHNIITDDTGPTWKVDAGAMDMFPQ